jgi:predicted outer membrane protein
MNNRNTLWAAMGVVSMCALSVAAFAQTPDTPAQTTTTTITTTTIVPETDHLSAGDRIFLMDLAHANAREIELSRVALHLADAPSVATYARHMLETHRDLQDQLMTTYGNRIFMRHWEGAVRNDDGMRDSDMMEHDQWLVNPVEMTKGNYNNWSYLYQTDWADVHRLRDMNGVTFERTYIQDMAQDHAMLLKEINRRDTETDNPDVKAIIEKVRPIVERHLDWARNWSLDYNLPASPYDQGMW